MLFEEMTSVFSEIHAKPINTHCGQNMYLVKVGGISIYNWSLKE